MDSDRQDAPARGRWARRAAAVLVGGAVAAGGLAAAAAPAYAQPSGCTLSGTWNKYTAKCTEGDGQYRVRLTCGKYYNGQWQTVGALGQWTTAGPYGSSTAVCPTGYAVSKVSIEFA